MAPTFDHQSLESHKGIEVNPQRDFRQFPGDENGHPFYRLLPIVLGVVGIAEPDGRPGLIGNAAPFDGKVFQIQDPSTMKGILTRFRRKGKHQPSPLRFRFDSITLYDHTTTGD
jgi:hypothetical protein